MLVGCNHGSKLIICTKKIETQVGNVTYPVQDNNGTGADVYEYWS